MVGAGGVESEYFTVGGAGREWKAAWLLKGSLHAVALQGRAGPGRAGPGHSDISIRARL
jgi:hypothetical protein